MKIALELVPRNEEGFINELELVKEKYNDIRAINIPDLLRFDLRSWDAARATKKYYEHVIPHLRAIDFSLDKEFPLKNFFQENSIKEVLIVQGDKPQDMSKITYPTSTVKFIKKIKKELDDITVYAAIDPYRSGIKNEFEYIDEKIEAGADGFMTQPFFDMRLLQIYAENLIGKKVFWGVSPVVSERSKNYWESGNMAYFPKDFEPTLEWNIEFGKAVLEFANSSNFDTYLMPIKVDIEKYLSGIFSHAGFKI